MEGMTIKVHDLEPAGRRALERALGKALADGQSLEIRVDPEPPALPAWCRVYEGLSDDDIDAVEATFRPRAQFSRPDGTP